ncbi:CDP-alcohol phosphatidyltransferase family protein [Zhouia sp. PK063]|uniref:CDP-alcohol phosphatidyltransferase family protein n=1 Tax=Zhouia sp. PK063 TaxID=3373602 RepID=UPI0037B8C92E
MKKQIPNLLTLLNLLCGCIAVIFAVRNQLDTAALFVVIGIFFDFFDGFAARALGVSSPLGLQLDSLADMVTSGVTPGIVMFQLLKSSVSPNGWELTSTLQMISGADKGITFLDVFPYLGLLITLGSAYRLANFNIDENQTASFIGLPTPANTLFILSLPLILLYETGDFWSVFILNPYVLVVITLLSTYMLNAKIPLFALKFKTFGFKGNEIRFLFLGASIVLLLLLKFTAIPFIIFLYVLLSVIHNMREKKSV